MKEYYFTFGFRHAHDVNGYTYDKDVVVLIRASNENEARHTMGSYFGLKWAFCYPNTPPDMTYFPRGIKELN